MSSPPSSMTRLRQVKSRDDIVLTPFGETTGPGLGWGCLMGAVIGCVRQRQISRPGYAHALDGEAPKYYAREVGNSQRQHQHR
jgi:hypothetical protein